jgi:hypothetical protein
MIPMRNSTIFKSRWMALLWAAGIIWFACDFAGSQPQDGNTADNQANAEAQNLGAALNSF